MFTFDGLITILCLIVVSMGVIELATFLIEKFATKTPDRLRRDDPALYDNAFHLLNFNGYWFKNTPIGAIVPQYVSDIRKLSKYKVIYDVSKLSDQDISTMLHPFTDEARDSFKRYAEEN